MYLNVAESLCGGIVNGIVWMGSRKLSGKTHVSEVLIVCIGNICLIKGYVLSCNFLNASNRLFACVIQIIYNNNFSDLETAVSEMNQATKAQLRLLAILDQSKVAFGDLANTMQSPANQLRMLQQNFSNLARIIGNILTLNT